MWCMLLFMPTTIKLISTFSHFFANLFVVACVYMRVMMVTGITYLMAWMMQKKNVSKCIHTHMQKNQRNRRVYTMGNKPIESALVWTVLDALFLFVEKKIFSSSLRRFQGIHEKKVSINKNMAASWIWISMHLKWWTQWVLWFRILRKSITWHFYSGEWKKNSKSIKQTALFQLLAQLNRCGFFAINVSWCG